MPFKKSIFIYVIVCMATRIFAAEVPINPLTREVRHKLKESISMVSQVEEKMAPKVSDMKALFDSYHQCKGHEADKGCVEIKNQLGKKYKEVLEALNQSADIVSSSIKNTTDSMGRSIRSKAGRKGVRTLYESIAKNGNIPVARGPLSKRLEGLLSMLGRGTGASLLEASLMTQADMIASSEIMEFLKQKSQHILMMVEVGQEIPLLNEEMVGVMAGVSKLFDVELDMEEMPLPNPKVTDSWE